jgi:hypothetical protein
VRTPLLTPQVVKTLVCVALLIGAGVIVFNYYQPEASWRKCALFSIKAMTTSGVPDNMSSEIEWFLIAYLPASVFSWAALVDALVNRRQRFTGRRGFSG